MKPLGIYIHIPFCKQKCAYCDFYSLGNADSTGYADALIKHIIYQKDSFKDYLIDTIYVGGGTPSLLPPKDMANIIYSIKDNFNVSNDAEISMETNPGTVNLGSLKIYKDCGINRLSFGLQSANDNELKTLSRIHSKDDFYKSFMNAREAGFENINVDVMYALPNQTGLELENTLDCVIGLKPEHISFYGLKIEPNTKFGKMKDIDKTLPDSDTQADMYLDACEKLNSSGYAQYEISNFSLPGYECKHNIKYWENADFAGFGPAAHSLIGNRLYAFKKDLHQFLNAPCNLSGLTVEEQFLSNEELINQYVMLAFRMNRGINIKEFEKRFDKNFDVLYKSKLELFIKQKLVIFDNDSYKFTREGMLLSNLILSEILDL